MIQHFIQNKVLHRSLKGASVSTSVSALAIAMVAAIEYKTSNDNNNTYNNNSTKCDHKQQNDLSPSSVTSSVTSTSITPTVITTAPKTPFSKPGPKIIFLGSGSSTGCPKPICSLLFPPRENLSKELIQLQKDMISSSSTSCHVSKLATIGNPLYNKNYRNNPSILISHSNDDGDGNDNINDNGNGNSNNEIEYKNVIIDVGKTFRESAIRWMPFHSIYNIDAVVLTHEHADAMLGLDDLRGFQRRPKMLKSTMSTSNSSSSSSSSPPMSIPIFLSMTCFNKVKQQFDYLVPKDNNINIDNNNNKNDCCNPNNDSINDKEKKIKEGEEGENNENSDNNEALVSKPVSTPKPVVKRAVASLEYNIVHHYKPFIAGGLKMIPLPVMHGEDLICNGYAFSIQGRHMDDDYIIGNRKDNNNNNDNDNNKRKMINIVYLSDISRMIPETEEFILNQLQKQLKEPTDILIIDSLIMKGSHPVHFSLEQALEVVQKIKPKRTFIVGMNCDAFPEHEKANEMLKKIDPSVQLAHDGLVLEL